MISVNRTDQAGADAPMKRAVRLIPSRKIRDGVELARDIVAGPPGTAPLLRAGVKLSARYAELLPKAGRRVGLDRGRPRRRHRHRRAADDRDAREGPPGHRRRALRRGVALRSGSGMPPRDRRVARRRRRRDGRGPARLPRRRARARRPVGLRRLHAPPQRPGHRARTADRPPRLGTDGWTDFRGRRRHDRLDERMRKLGLGLLVHDVGKLAVPPEILNKPGRLTDEEMGVMRTHAHAGVELLRPADLSPLATSSCATTTSASTAPATPRACSARRSRSSRASPPSPTSTTPSPPSASTSPPRRPTSACA